MSALLLSRLFPNRRDPVSSILVLEQMNESAATAGNGVHRHRADARLPGALLFRSACTNTWPFRAQRSSKGSNYPHPPRVLPGGYLPTEQVGGGDTREAR